MHTSIYHNLYKDDLSFTQELLNERGVLIGFTEVPIEEYDVEETRAVAVREDARGRATSISSMLDAAKQKKDEQSNNIITSQISNNVRDDDDVKDVVITNENIDSIMFIPSVVKGDLWGDEVIPSVESSTNWGVEIIPSVANPLDESGWGVEVIPSVVTKGDDVAKWGKGIDQHKGVSIEAMLRPTVRNKHGDARMLKRIYEVYKWAVLRFRKDDEVQVPFEELHATFGIKTVGNWLRSNLLTITLNYANFPEHDKVRCYTYLIDRDFLAQLKKKLDDAGFVTDPWQIAYDRFKPRIAAQLDARCIEHKLSTDQRWYNAASSCPRDVRDYILAEHGYVKGYDVASAKPTMLFQAALRSPAYKGSAMIQKYIGNPKAARNYIAKAAGLSYESVKELITLIFGGHVLGWSKLKPTIRRHFATKADYERFYDVIGGEGGLYDEIRTMLKHLPIERKRDASGRKERLTEKLTARFYLQEENRVRIAVKMLLSPGTSLKNDPVFWLHDGWITHEPINIEAMQKRIERETGYDLIIETK